MTHLLLDITSATIDWSRAQFALTAIYHWLFVPLTLGLAVIMGIAETCYYRTNKPFWKDVARFWQKLFGINFAMGVATGIILEFATKIHHAEMVAPSPVSQVEARWKPRLTLFHPKNMTATKVLSMKKARMPSMASGAPKMSPTNQE